MNKIVKKYAVCLGCAILLSGLLGIVCQLNIITCIVIGMMFALFFVRYAEHITVAKNYYAKFQDVVMYLDQMGNSFKKNNKILPSLRDTVILFPEGMMKDTLTKAIEEFNKGGIHTSANALAVIDKNYACEQVNIFHNYLSMSEREGGDSKATIDILAQRQNDWASAVEKCKSKMKSSLVSVLISVIMLYAGAEFLTIFIARQLEFTNTNILTEWPEQILMMVVTFFSLFIINLALKEYAIDWLDDVSKLREESLYETFEWLDKYDANKEFNKNIKWAAIPVIFTIAGLFLFKQKAVVLLIGLTISALVLFKHRFNRYISIKMLQREIQRDFPNWMLYVILLMQTESVQGAIIKSQDYAPKVMKYPLQKFEEALGKDRISPAPYFSFLEEFSLPKIAEAMKMLYSISSGTGGDEKTQMLNVIRKNNEMITLSENIKNDNRTAGMYAYIYLPVFPIGIKLMIDIMLISTSAMSYIFTIM